METIELFRHGRNWLAKSDNPEVLRLFGSDTLPTAFSAQAHSNYVLDRMHALNPDCNVFVRSCDND